MNLCNLWVIIKLNLNIPSNEPQKNPRWSFLICQIALAIWANIKRKETNLLHLR